MGWRANNGAFTGQNNQAGALAPTTGVVSNTLRRAAASGLLYSDVDLGAWHYRHPFQYWIGMLFPVGVASTAYVGRAAYKGILPADVQPKLNVADAWSDPLRGSP
jgi:hypothetical protein